MSRLLHQLVGGIVRVEQFELDVGVFRVPDVLDHLAPQHVALHHIGFIDGGDAAAAALGQRKGDPGNALDLGRGIEVGVKRPEAAAFNRFNPARLGKKCTAAEFAHHHHIGLLSQAFSKRCGVDQGGMTPCGPQAGVHIECLAQAHQAVFILRSAVDLDLIPLRATDCAHQHSVGPGCFVHGIVSAEHPVLIVGRTAQ